MAATDKQQHRLQNLSAADQHVPGEAIWGIYQRMMTAYRDPDCPHGGL